MLQGKILIVYGDRRYRAIGYQIPKAGDYYVGVNGLVQRAIGLANRASLAKLGGIRLVVKRVKCVED